MIPSLGRSVLVCLAIGLVAPAAAAEGSPADKAAAQALFEQGKQLLESGNAEQACPKFEASQQLDAGIGTQLYLADCYQRVGKTASAWAIFLEAESVAKAQGQNDRAQIARDRAKALEKELAKITLVADDAASMQNAQVTINDRAIPSNSWGVPLPIDPGAVRIEVKAVGKKPWTTTLDVAAGASEHTVKIPTLEAAPAQPIATEPAAPHPTKPAATTATAPSADKSAQTRIAGWVTTGVGAVGVGIGSYFGLHAISKNSDSKAHCRTATLCDPTGLGLRKDAKDAATASTVAFAVGGTLVVVGVTLLVFGRSDNERSPAVGISVAPSLATLELGGRW